MPDLFGDKLRFLRLRRKMTQQELAQHFGITTQSNLSRLEARRRARRSTPSLNLVIQVADLFGVTTDYLLRDTIPIEHPTSYTAMRLPTSTLAQLFGAKLRELRKQREMTQVDLAGRLGGLSQAAVSAFELGEKTPSITIVLLCADLFNVPTDALLRDIV